MPVPKSEIAVAAVILEQLGGRRFLAMTGAKHLLAHPSALSFRLPSSFAKKGINYVRIELNVMDLYDITFSCLRGTETDHVEQLRDVYCEQLRELFTSTTGLETSL